MKSAHLPLVIGLAGIASVLALAFAIDSGPSQPTEAEVVAREAVSGFNIDRSPLPPTEAEMIAREALGGLDIVSLASQETTAILDFLDEVQSCSLASLPPDVPDSVLEGAVLPSSYTSVHYVDRTEYVFEGRALARNMEEVREAWRVDIALHVLVERCEAGLVEWLAKRAEVLPPRRLDVFVGWAFLDYVRNVSFGPYGSRCNDEFWADSCADWEAMLVGKSPIYRLLALSNAHLFIQDQGALLSAYVDGLGESDAVLQLAALRGLQRLANAESLRIVRAFHAGLTARQKDVTLILVERHVTIETESAVIAKEIEAKILLQNAPPETDDVDEKTPKEQPSPEQLVETIKNGTDPQAEAALLNLVATESWQQSLHSLPPGSRPDQTMFESLLKLLSEVSQARADLIVKYGLTREQREEALTATEKKQVDETIGFLRGQLATDTPLISSSVAIDSLGKTVGSIRGKPPYGNGEVVDTMLSLLDSDDMGRLEAAARWLRRLGLNDFARTEEIIAALENKVTELSKRHDESDRRWKPRELQVLESEMQRLRSEYARDRPVR